MLPVIWPCFSMNWLARLQLLTKACFLAICFSVVVYILRSYYYVASRLSHMGMTVLQILHVQIWQSLRLLYVSRFPMVPLRRFTQYNRKIMLNLIQANNCYGCGLFVFLVFNIPINCYLLISVTTGQVVKPVNYCYTFNAFLQLIVIIGIHVVSADLNSYLLKSNPKFYNCMVRSAIFTPPRELLRFSLYFQAFHNKKRYGISYSRFGRISKLSFTKVDLLMY